MGWVAVSSGSSYLGTGLDCSVGCVVLNLWRYSLSGMTPVSVGCLLTMVYTWYLLVGSRLYQYWAYLTVGWVMIAEFPSGCLQCVYPVGKVEKRQLGSSASRW